MPSVRIIVDQGKRKEGRQFVFEALPREQLVLREEYIMTLMRDNKFNINHFMDRAIMENDIQGVSHDMQSLMDYYINKYPDYPGKWGGVETYQWHYATDYERILRAFLTEIAKP